MKSTKKSKKQPIFAKIWPYLLAFAAVVGLVFVGSQNKVSDAPDSLNMATLASNDYQATADQLTELYVVASVSNSINLASADTAASNYVITTVMQSVSQSSTDSATLEKPTIVDTSDISRGVQSYTVVEGDTMESIAAEFGLTTDQIRWSNGLKTTEVTVGQTLSLPSVAGIVYTVKSGDTLDSIVSKTGSDKDEVISVNDLETDQNLSEGRQLVLPNGTLPETERPEYVAPTTTRRTYTYSYSGSSSNRQNVSRANYTYVSSGNPYGWGWCTYYAWGRRAAIGRTLRGGINKTTWGNAKEWASTASTLGYTVNHTPAVGAVFQSSSGGHGYGHVGVVESVNSDGSVTVSEMNWMGFGVVSTGTIPASQVGNFYYIH